MNHKKQLIKTFNQDITAIKLFLDHSLKSNSYINKFQLQVKLKEYEKEIIEKINKGEI